MAGIHGNADVAADEPDQRDQHEIGKNAAGAENHGTAQAHHVAETEDEADGVESEDHAGAIGKRIHHRHELKVTYSFHTWKVVTKKS